MRYLNITLLVFISISILCFIYIRKQNTKLNKAIIKSYEVEYNSIIDNFNELYISRSSLNLKNNFVIIDSTLSEYVNNKVINFFALIKTYQELLKDGLIHSSQNMLINLNWQTKIIRDYPMSQDFNYIYLLQLRNGILSNSLNEIYYDKIGCFYSRFELVRNMGKTCDSVKIYEFMNIPITKIEIRNISVIKEFGHSLTIPKMELKSLRDSLQISVLNKQGNKFIPAEVHFLN